MPYYGQGDYYRGDYYRGDPGILGSIGKFLGGIVKPVIRTASSLLPGPAGAVARALTGGVLRRAGGAVTLSNEPSAIIERGAQIFRRLRGGGRTRIPTEIIDTFGGLPGGAGGGFGGGGGFGMMGRRKRMNVANPKALRRALRRVAGFGKLAKRAKRDIARAASAIGVRQGGSRGRITRSEAARALRR